MAEATAIPDTSHQTAHPLSETEMAALIAKHRKAIDEVIVLNSQEQQDALRELGVDPEEFKRHNSDFYARDNELRRQDVEARQKAGLTGWGIFGATLIGTTIFRDIFGKGNRLLQGFGIGTTSFLAGIIGQGIGVQLFARKVRDAADVLAKDVPYAMACELAVLLENREQDQKAAGDAPASNAVQGHQPDQNDIPKTTVSAIHRRNANFSAQAMVDKTAGQGAAAHR